MADYYHVRLIPKGPNPSRRGRLEVEVNLSFEELERRFLAPYSKARPVVINGRIIAIDTIERIRIFKSEELIVSRDFTPESTVEVTSELIAISPDSESESASYSSQDVRPATGTRDVFVVHGEKYGGSRSPI